MKSFSLLNATAAASTALQRPACRVHTAAGCCRPRLRLSWNGDSGRDEALLLPRHEILASPEAQGQAEEAGDLPGLPRLQAPDGSPDIEFLADYQHPRPNLQFQNNTQALPTLTYWIPQGREVWIIFKSFDMPC